MPEPVVSVSAMRAREARTWAAGISKESVIRRAGWAVGEVARRMTSVGAPVLLLAGRGHNGDDAEVAAGALSDRETLFLRVRDATTFGRAHAWLLLQEGNPRALVVDGLFGIGLNRPLDGDWAGLVHEVNSVGIRVLSIDVPSGLDADTGEAQGIAIVATTTIALGSVKRGLLSELAAPYVGRLELASEIGLADVEKSGPGWWTLADDFRRYPPRRPPSGHKGTFGHARVVAGTHGYHGAAVLAALGALRARPGLVSVVTDPRCYGPVASQLRAAMVREWNGEPLDEPGITSVVIGPGLASPGLSPAWRQEIRRVWAEARCPVVVDASALDWLPAGRVDAGVRVVTPHPGEAARLLGRTPTAVQADRFGAVDALRDRWPSAGTWVVLKGRHTLVAGQRGNVWVNSTGNPGLAQGGSGDVLAGYLGGLLAQPALAVDPGLAIRYGVWRHGLSADRLEDRGLGWTIDELVAELGTGPSRS